MDSIQLNLNGGVKVQGAPLGQVLQAMDPRTEASTVVLHTDAETVSLPLVDVLADDDVRIFGIFGEVDVTFAVARMNGEVIAFPVTRIQVTSE
jgi:hypothetical protein